ncbi:MAG: hypothetical protein LAO31_22595 [Acidobacteriia bacterium]|nr:hypothetical protein [Terriglobia bacterium]
MTRPLRIVWEGAWYHAIARGNQRGVLFLDDENRHLNLDFGFYLESGVWILLFLRLWPQLGLDPGLPERSAGLALTRKGLRQSVAGGPR